MAGNTASHTIKGFNMSNRSEYNANIQLINTSTFSRGVSAKRKSEVSAVAWFVLIFGAIGYLLAVAFFAG